MSFLKPILAFLGLLLGLIVVSELPLDTSGWPPATCLSLEGCFCEVIHPGGLAQPVNAWSSLIFTLAGLFVAARSRQRKAASGEQSLENGMLYAAALVVIGLGSAFYHASLTFVGQFFDVLGMYLLVSFLVLVDLQALGVIRQKRFAGLYISLNLLLAACLIWLPEFRRWLFLGLILVVLVLEVGLRFQKQQRQSRFFWLALGAFGLAFLIWNLDNSRIWCVPESILQGHALWHFLGALAGWWMWLYVEQGK